MIKIIKRKRNPNLKGESFIDDKFIDLLFESIVHNRPYEFQQALTYKNIGLENCEDCIIDNKARNYERCACENFLDDYNIDDAGGRNTKQNLIDAVKKQFKYLSFPQLMKLKTRLINIDYSNKADTAFYISPNSVRIYREDVKELIKDINNVISKRK